MAFNNKRVEQKPTYQTNDAPVDNDRAVLREEAIKSVKNQHGPYVNRLRNYEELIADAERQMIHAVEVNKTF